MSDPVTNVEIEDVLSSIRRLVSAEGRATGAGASRSARAAPQKGSVERLVLTPALRVDDTAPAESAPAAEESAPAAEDPLAGIDIESPEPATSSGRTRQAEDAEILAEHEAVAEPAAQDAGEDTGHATGHATADEADPEVPEFLLRRDAVTGADAGDDGAPLSGAEPRAEARDGGDVAEAPGMSVEAGAAEAEAPMPEAGDSAAIPDIDMAELEARIAEFEAAVAEQQDEWEPDGTPAGDPDAKVSSGTLPWQDVEDEGGADPGAELGTVEPAPGADAMPEGPGEDDIEAQDRGDLWMAEDAVLDEEALRDMVAEIVRQELQGALGERITRNVRKLVRREIHRALLSQGLD